MADGVATPETVVLGTVGAEPPRANWAAGLVALVALGVAAAAAGGVVLLLVWLVPKVLGF